jgi:hypothetical protein
MSLSLSSIFFPPIQILLVSLTSMSCPVLVKWLTLQRQLAATQLVKMSSAVTHKPIQLRNLDYGLDASILAHQILRSFHPWSSVIMHASYSIQQHSCCLIQAMSHYWDDLSSILLNDQYSHIPPQNMEGGGEKVEGEGT